MHQQQALSQSAIDEFVGAAHSNIAKVKAMLDENPELLGASSSQNETALQAAAHMGRKLIAEHLLSRGAPLDICTAALLGRIADVDRMLAADPTVARATGAHGIPLMFHAALGGNMDVLQRLIGGGADINAGDGLNTALHAAAIIDSPDIADWLLRHGADRGPKDFAGKTPIEVAVELKRTRVQATLQPQ